MGDTLRIDTEGVEALADDLRRALPILTSAARSLDDAAFGPSSVGPALRTLAARCAAGTADLRTEVVTMQTSLERISAAMSRAADDLESTDAANGGGITSAGRSS